MYQTWFVVADAAASVTLAAACSLKAALARSNAAGAILFGAFSALAAPLVREVLLNGRPGIAACLDALAAWSLLGAIAGLALAARGRPERSFYWLDAVGLALACSMSSFAALAVAGPVAAMSVGLLAGLAPGMLRDIVLGTGAMCLEEAGYASAAALGVMATIGLAMAPARWQAVDVFWSAPFLPCLAGIIVSLSVRAIFFAKSD